MYTVIEFCLSAKICMSLSCTKWCSSSKRFAAVILLMLTCAIFKGREKGLCVDV